MAADVFTNDDAINLLKRKTIIFMGDSNTRGMYKDFITLLQQNEYTTSDNFKNKMEDSYLNDRLMQGGLKTNDRDYIEEREYICLKAAITVKFYFITQIYCSYVVEKLIPDIRRAEPDVIFANSCVWDLTRWGPQCVDVYKTDLPKFLLDVRRAIKPDCLFVWLSTLPVARDAKGGFITEQRMWMRKVLRFDIPEANNFARKLITQWQYDMLDLHYYFHDKLERRCKDGIHWYPIAMRYMTNLMLTHISLAWRSPMPGIWTSEALKEYRNLEVSSEVVQFESKLLANEKFVENPAFLRGTEPISIHDKALLRKRPLDEDEADPQKENGNKKFCEHLTPSDTHQSSCETELSEDSARFELDFIFPSTSSFSTFSNEESFKIPGLDLLD